MRDAEDVVARFRGLKTGILDVGMVSTAKYFVPRMLANFRDDHPGVEIRLQVCNNRDEVVNADAARRGRSSRSWDGPAAVLADSRGAVRDAPARAGDAG